LNAVESKQDYLAKLQVAVSQLHNCGATHIIHSYDEHFLKLNGKLPTKSPIVEPVPPQSVMRKLLAQAKAPKPKAIISQSTLTGTTTTQTKPGSN
jgi:hypothetical protein